MSKDVMLTYFSKPSSVVVDVNKQVTAAFLVPGPPYDLLPGEFVLVKDL